MLRLAADHLWQSTLCTGVAWLVTLALRKNHAGVRFGVWLAASVKFLVPFAALVTLGTYLPWKPAPLPASDTTEIFESFSQPFSQAAVVIDPTPTAPSFDVWDAVMTAVPVAWGLGTVLILAVWATRWRRVSSLVDRTQPLDSGREHGILRHLESRLGRVRRLPIRISTSSLEPGIVGLFRPVLLWPQGISARLSDAQIESIVAHELAHVLRRDNLAAAVHMVVEALFWFHPLVWWIGARLVDERERACDEAVVRLGSEPHAYAESILRTCEHHLESPLACVSGVTGADLKNRIEAILRPTTLLALSRTRQSLLALAIVVPVATPLTVGIITAPPVMAQSASSNARFDVVSVKPNQAEGKALARATPNRIEMVNFPLRLLILNAFDVQNHQIVGAPKWVNDARYDVSGTFDGRSTDQDNRARLRNLLTDRFQLVKHTEMRVLPIYQLVRVSKNDPGPGLHPTALDCSSLRGQTGRAGQPAEVANCGLRMDLRGAIRGGAITMDTLATSLSGTVDRVVRNTTGLNGEFDLELTFSPDSLDRSLAPGASSNQENRPSIFTALHEQLGLKLESSKGPVEVLVIDRIERPRDNNAAAAPQSPALVANARARTIQQTPVSLLKRNDKLPSLILNARVRDILRTISELTGIKVTYDPDYRDQDRAYLFEAYNTTVEDALNKALLANQLFYKVIDERSILVIPDTPQKRQQYGQTPAAALATPGPPPAFGAVSIKENRNPSPERGAGFLQGGRFVARSAPLRMVITAAYADITTGPAPADSQGMFSGSAGPLPGFQLAGGPDWIDSVGYDIQATSTEPEMSGGRMRQMLRALLADRFRMTTRVEKRELPAYRLRPNRRDEQLGPQMKPSLGGCTPPGSKASDPPVPTCGFRQNLEGTTIRLNAASISMVQLANRLQQLLSAPVVDGTVIPGWFDVSDLQFMRPTAAPDASSPSDLSIFTALQEQLGLKLEPTRERVDVLVIDRIERPTEN